ncbi:MAG: MscL family protein [bacterium]|nr:MscL family protein [bacterium]
MKGFIDFIRRQGVVGLAVGFILGGAVAKLVSALIQDLISPFIGLITGSAGGLAEAALNIGPINLMWGHFLSVLIDFLVIAIVVYFGIKGLGLDKLDKKD